MHTNETKAKWLNSAQAVLDALQAWGKQPYIGGYSTETYSKFDVFGLESALREVIKQGREELRPKFDRRAAENRVWGSADFLGMYRVTADDGSLMGPYQTREHAINALEAIFNAEAQ